MITNDSMAQDAMDVIQLHQAQQQQTKHDIDKMLEGYDTNATASLLTNYKIMKHKASNIEQEKVPIASEGRNFALGVLECIAPRIDDFKVDMLSTVDHTGELDGEAFVDLVAYYVKHSADAPFIFYADEEKRERVRGQMLALEEPECNLSESLSAMSPLHASSGGPQATSFVDLKRRRRSTFVGNSSHVEVPFSSVVADEELFMDRLWRLFRALDVEDSGAVSWEEFSDFMTDVAVRGPVQPPKDPVNLYRAHPGPDRAGRPIHEMRYFPELGQVGMLSMDTQSVHGHEPQHVLEFYHPGQWATKASSMWFTGSVISAEYLPMHKSVLVSSADLHLRLYDTKTESQKPVLEVPAEETYCLLRWSRQWKQVYAAATNGSVTTWTLDTKKRSMKKGQHYKLHQSSITQLLFLPLDGSIVTSSMDPGLTIQEPHRGEVIAEFTGHKSAICDVTYSEDHHFLISCGFDKELYLWSLHSAHPGGNSGKGTKPILLYDRDEPHKPPIVSVHCIPHTPQIVSMDQSGMMKIWDIRTFKVLQNIFLYPRTQTTALNRDKEYFTMTNYLPESKELMCATRRTARPVAYTDIHSNYDSQTSEEIPIAIGFSESSGAMVSVTQSGIQTYELLSGVMSGTYRTKKDHSEATTAAIDFNGRKVAVGHRSGWAGFYSANNGHFFTAIKVSSHEIVDIAFHKYHCSTFAIDSAGTLFGFSDKPDEALKLKKLESGKHAKFIRVSNDHDCLLVFHAGFDISLYSIRPDKGSAPVWVANGTVATDKHKNDEHGEVYCASFLGDAPAFCCADSTGYVSIFTVPPHRDTFALVWRWMASGMWDLSTMAFWNEYQLMYLADASGAIHCFDMSEVIEESGLMHYVNRKRNDLVGSFDSDPTRKQSVHHLVVSPLVQRRQSTARSNSITSNTSIGSGFSSTSIQVFNRIPVRPLDNSDLQLLRKPFVAVKGTRIAQLLLIPSMGVLFTNTAERDIHCFPMSLQKPATPKDRLGYLSLDRCQYTSPNPDELIEDVKDLIADPPEFVEDDDLRNNFGSMASLTSGATGDGSKTGVLLSSRDSSPVGTPKALPKKALPKPIQELSILTKVVMKRATQFTAFSEPSSGPTKQRSGVTFGALPRNTTFITDVDEEASEVVSRTLKREQSSTGLFRDLGKTRSSVQLSAALATKSMLKRFKSNLNRSQSIASTGGGDLQKNQSVKTITRLRSTLSGKSPSKQQSQHSLMGIAPRTSQRRSSKADPALTSSSSEQLTSGAVVEGEEGSGGISIAVPMTESVAITSNTSNNALDFSVRTQGTSGSEASTDEYYESDDSTSCGDMEEVEVKIPRATLKNAREETTAINRITQLVEPSPLGRPVHYTPPPTHEMENNANARFKKRKPRRELNARELQEHARRRGEAKYQEVKAKMVFHDVPRCSAGVKTSKDLVTPEALGSYMMLSEEHARQRELDMEEVERKRQHFIELGKADTTMGPPKMEAPESLIPRSQCKRAVESLQRRRQELDKSAVGTHSTVQEESVRGRKKELPPKAHTPTPTTPPRGGRLHVGTTSRAATPSGTARPLFQEGVSAPTSPSALSDATHDDVVVVQRALTPGGWIRRPGTQESLSRTALSTPGSMFSQGASNTVPASVRATTSALPNAPIQYSEVVSPGTPSTKLRPSEASLQPGVLPSLSAPRFGARKSIVGLRGMTPGTEEVEDAPLTPWRTTPTPSRQQPAGSPLTPGSIAAHERLLKTSKPPTPDKPFNFNKGNPFKELDDQKKSAGTSEERGFSVTRRSTVQFFEEDPRDKAKREKKPPIAATGGKGSKLSAASPHKGPRRQSILN